MGGFLENEKLKQIEFKADSPDLSNEARADGIYKGKPRSFCLPLEYAEQNLFSEIRHSAIRHFAKHSIKWHDGQNGKPSNHLCSSQVCCINFLFPFADKPEVLAKVLQPVFPNIKMMLPIESGQYVSFEWIGQENYLGEKVTRNGKRSRGALFTSADAAVMFERTDGKRQMVLIEWKYTESYGGTSLKIAKSGTDRTEIYKHLFLEHDNVLDKDLLPSFGSLFYEPFYQFMRQQYLAHEMEKAHEMGADIVSVLHIAPAHNHDFHKITSPELKKLGESAIDVWKKLVRYDRRFISVSVESLFGNLSEEHFPEIRTWLDYIHDRYRWVFDK
jgi:hypothetical protein